MLEDMISFDSCQPELRGIKTSYLAIAFLSHFAKTWFDRIVESLCISPLEPTKAKCGGTRLTLLLIQSKFEKCQIVSVGCGSGS